MIRAIYLVRRECSRAFRQVSLISLLLVYVDEKWCAVNVKALRLICHVQSVKTHKTLCFSSLLNWRAPDRGASEESVILFQIWHLGIWKKKLRKIIHALLTAFPLRTALIWRLLTHRGVITPLCTVGPRFTRVPSASSGYLYPPNTHLREHVYIQRALTAHIPACTHSRQPRDLFVPFARSYESVA